jgi:hypothetical protein
LLLWGLNGYNFWLSVFGFLDGSSVSVLSRGCFIPNNNSGCYIKGGIEKMEDLERVHVGIDEGGNVVCKDCVRKADPDEKFMSSTVEGGGQVSCCDCGCDLN